MTQDQFSGLHGKRVELFRKRKEQVEGLPDETRVVEDPAGEGIIEGVAPMSILVRSNAFEKGAAWFVWEVGKGTHGKMHGTDPDFAVWARLAEG